MSVRGELIMGSNILGFLGRRGHVGRESRVVSRHNCLVARDTKGRLFRQRVKFMRLVRKFVLVILIIFVFVYIRCLV